MPDAQMNQNSVLDLTTLIEKVKDLPPPPTVVMRAMEMTLDPSIAANNLRQVIAQDQALLAKILRIVNSAMYSLRREISAVSHAVSILGLETVKSIIMANLLMIHMGIGFEKDKNLLLEKQPAAEQLNLDASKLEVIMVEVQTAIQAPSALRG